MSDLEGKLYSPKEDRKGITCGVCWTPFESANELYHCPAHHASTSHDECAKTCLELGCGQKLVPFVPPKSKEEFSAGIAEKLSEQSDDLRGKYVQIIDDLGRRAKVALESIYESREKLRGYYRIESKGEINFKAEVQIPSSPTSNRTYEVVVIFDDEVGFNSHLYKRLAVWAEQRKVISRKLLWRKETLVPTGNSEIVFYDSSFGNNIIAGFGDFLTYAKSPNAFSSTQAVNKYLSTLVMLCSLPRLIKQKIEDASQELLKERRTNEENLKRILTVYRQAIETQD